MKLKIARFKSVFGLPAIVLTDEKGEMLPGQRDTVFSSPLEGAPEITVTFVVNGKDISMDFDLDYNDLHDDPEAGRWEKPGMSRESC